MFELTMKIIDEEYVDDLIISLVRQGYEVYYRKEEREICIAVAKDDLFELRDEQHMKN
jgi:hypothetical protein